MLYGYAVARVNPGTNPEEFDWEPEEEPAFLDIVEARRHLDQIKAQAPYLDVALVRIIIERM